MSTSADFFNEAQKKEITRAIALAEQNTLGEIRLYLEKHCSGDLLKRAAVVFHQLKMDKTMFRTGVLIYIAHDDRRFAIIGDSGIHEKVTDRFWEEAREQMRHYFSEGKFLEGVLVAIETCGEQLKTYFPTDGANPDELSNEMVTGES